MSKNNKPKKKILYISGTRADYGLMREVLRAIKKCPSLDLKIAVCGMHLMEEFGRTINEVKKDDFKIHRIEVVPERDDKESVANFIGTFILKLTMACRKIKPDIILLLGDRPEMLAGAIVGAYLNILVVHIHGGDVSSTIDEMARHAITKLSHLHFVATKKSAARLIKMGEDDWRVHLVGAPGLDIILKGDLTRPGEIARKYKLDLSKPVLLVLQHPAAIGSEEAARQMQQTMEAIKELGLETVVIYPNADPGGRAMIKVIEKYRKEPAIQIYKTLPRDDYLGLMKISAVLVGNSSSGIIEAPSFKLPVVNIGERQKGRERGNHIIDVGYNKKEIKRAVKKALYAQKFRDKLKKCKNPYGDGQAARRITDVLSKVKIDKKLLNKKITY